MALTRINSRYLFADFVFEYYFDCSKKIDRNCFCVTKNRFFLIRFLICVIQATAWLLCPSRGELDYHIITHIGLSSVFRHFFEIFSDFFKNFFRPIKFRYFVVHISRTACSFYHSPDGMSTVFHNFFSFFFGNFKIFLSENFYHKMLCFPDNYATIEKSLYAGLRKCFRF